jgi:hypothetical protein
MKAICDSCKQNFELESLKERNLDGGIVEIYYNCPHCNKEYHVCVTSEQTRKVQKQMEELRGVIRDRLSKNMDVTLQRKQIFSLQKKHKKMMDKLNGRA